MPLLAIRQLNVSEPLPGWRGRYFHSARMTFAHYEFTRGASIHVHHHPQEEVYEVIEGELEITLESEIFIAGPGDALVVPANALHSVRALSDGRALVVDSPARPEFA